MNKRYLKLHLQNSYATKSRNSILSAFLPYYISVTFFVFLMLCFMNRYHPVLVSGNSMNPTYHDCDLLTCNNEFSVDTIKRNDVVVFKKNHLTYIKRVIAIPGDTIQIIDGSVYLNSERIEDEFGYIKDSGIANTPYVLNENEFFCLGDNRNHSTDSRKMGAVNFCEIRYIVDDILLSSNVNKEQLTTKE